MSAQLDAADSTPARGVFDALTGAGLASATCIGVVAHQDDIELGMPFAPLAALTSPTEAFAGITCSDGTSGFRAPGYEGLSSAEFARVRRHEQRCAAVEGGYVEQLQLGFRETRAPDAALVAELAGELHGLLSSSRPHTLVTHSPLDRHPWHRAVARATIQAACSMPTPPRRFLGVEIWGGLEWLRSNVETVPFTDPDGLCERWASCYRSQEAHTPYCAAAAARRFANGTYRLGRTIGLRQDVVYALDLAPLLDGRDPRPWLQQLLHETSQAILADWDAQ